MREDNELFHRFARVKDHPNYGVNALGEIKNLKTGRILRPDETNRGYGRVTLDGTKYYIHRLVAETFIPNPYSYDQIVHIDGDHTNNFYMNLIWK